jgi:hypothetical protein
MTHFPPDFRYFERQFNAASAQLLPHPSTIEALRPLLHSVSGEIPENLRDTAQTVYEIGGLGVHGTVECVKSAAHTVAEADPANLMYVHCGCGVTEDDEFLVNSKVVAGEVTVPFVPDLRGDGLAAVKRPAPVRFLMDPAGTVNDALMTTSHVTVQAHDGLASLGSGFQRLLQTTASGSCLYCLDHHLFVPHVKDIGAFVQVKVPMMCCAHHRHEPDFYVVWVHGEIILKVMKVAERHLVNPTKTVGSEIWNTHYNFGREYSIDEDGNDLLHPITRERSMQAHTIIGALAVVIPRFVTPVLWREGHQAREYLRQLTKCPDALAVCELTLHFGETQKALMPPPTPFTTAPTTGNPTPDSSPLDKATRSAADTMHGSEEVAIGLKIAGSSSDKIDVPTGVPGVKISELPDHKYDKKIEEYELLTGEKQNGVESVDAMCTEMNRWIARVIGPMTHDEMRGLYACAPSKFNELFAMRERHFRETPPPTDRAQRHITTHTDSALEFLTACEQLHLDLWKAKSVGSEMNTQNWQYGANVPMEELLPAKWNTFDKERENEKLGTDTRPCTRGPGLNTQYASAKKNAKTSLKQPFVDPKVYNFHKWGFSRKFFIKLCEVLNKFKPRGIQSPQQEGAAYQPGATIFDRTLFYLDIFNDRSVKHATPEELRERLAKIVSRFGGLGKGEGAVGSDDMGSMDSTNKQRPDLTGQRDMIENRLFKEYFAKFLPGSVGMTVGIADRLKVQLKLFSNHFKVLAEIFGRESGDKLTSSGNYMTVIVTTLSTITMIMEDSWVKTVVDPWALQDTDIGIRRIVPDMGLVKPLPKRETRMSAMARAWSRKWFFDASDSIRDVDLVAEGDDHLVFYQRAWIERFEQSQPANLQRSRDKNGIDQETYKKHLIEHKILLIGRKRIKYMAECGLILEPQDQNGRIPPESEERGIKWISERMEFVSKIVVPYRIGTKMHVALIPKVDKFVQSTRLSFNNTHSLRDAAVGKYTGLCFSALDSPVQYWYARMWGEWWSTHEHDEEDSSTAPPGSDLAEVVLKAFAQEGNNAYNACKVADAVGDVTTVSDVFDRLDEKFYSMAYNCPTAFVAVQEAFMQEKPRMSCEVQDAAASAFKSIAEQLRTRDHPMSRSQLTEKSRTLFLSFL